MSHFLIATGPVPSLNDTAGLSFVPADQAQPYVSDIVASIFSGPERDHTYLLDDGTQTSDEVISEAGEAIFRGSSFPDTRLGAVIERLTAARCIVRIWWASEPGAHDRVEVFRDGDQYIRELTARLQRGNDLNLLYEPVA